MEHSDKRVHESRPNWRVIGYPYGQGATHCDKCGAKLTEHFYHTGQYDIYDGVEHVERVATCPNKRWWNRHTKVSLTLRADDQCFGDHWFDNMDMDKQEATE